jgi:two-component system C4-dicarboxylate transport sensor histidine kinase DctB
VLAAGVAMMAAGEFGRQGAVADLEQQSHTDASLKMALLQAVLERPRSLPLVLSGDGEVQTTLAHRDPGDVSRLDRKLEGLIDGTKASVIYVIGTNGIAIASSNWREPDSFVGNDYTFRDYFRRAMTQGAGEQYALGSVSKRPGLYIARRVVDVEGQSLGVVVVKVEFDQLEAEWMRSGRPTYVVDGRGIVLMTSVPSWRFMTIAAIEPARLVSIRDSLQFGAAPLSVLPFAPKQVLGDLGGSVQVTMPGETGRQDFLRLALPVPGTDWLLEHLVRIDPPVADAVRQSRLLALAAVLPLIAASAFLINRRQRSLSKIAEEQAARHELERRVATRTRDLTLARDRLEQEIDGHRATEQRLQTVQQELVQANRLAILGQVAAGVAHEINQPVATIRAYADNAKTFLDRGKTASAVENMETIAGLTDRIGVITNELKAFARKGRAAGGPTPLRSVVEGAVMLLRSRFAGRLEMLDIALPAPDVMVFGSRIRLEQVLINLFQNALEAIGDRPDGRVTVRVSDSGGDVAIWVADNGPGFAPGIRAALFNPFNTSKEGGLGLGLVISKDIVTDYGGRIEVESDADGTRFTVYLKKAFDHA